MILAVCANARDAMPAGGCLIIEVTDLDGASLARDPNGGVRPPAAVRLSFQDTGCGMDSSVRQRLFEPFFTTKGIDGGGLGLGLAAVHGIVKQHRGWMEVESTPGLGSTFRAFFPKAPAPAAA
jgi:signal transduction histidine kinase